MQKNYPDLRYKKTVDFLKNHFSPGCAILDLGTPNELSKIIDKEGYIVFNTNGEDLDVHYKVIDEFPSWNYTAFEIFEHMFSPFNILNHIKQGRIVISVPLNVWFSPAYWNENDKWDQHYHEFEPRQLNSLLHRTGWTIIHAETWTSPDKLRFGLRPLLRYIWPSYYFVYAVKIKPWK